MGILYWYIVQLVSKTLSLSSLLYRYSIYSKNSTFTIVHTPLASFMADVTFGRFKTLLLLHVSFLLHVGILLGGILLTYTVGDFNNYFYAMLSVSLIALFLISVQELIANVLQFGTDQLLAFYWCDIFGALLALSTNISGHIVAISPNTKRRKLMR